MATFAQQSALQRQKAEEAKALKAFASKQKLTEIQTEAVLDALGEQVAESRKEERELSKARATRASKAGELANKYLSARSAGTDAAKIRAFVDLSRAAKQDRIDFAKAAYVPDEALFRGIMNQIPEYEKGAVPSKDRDIARKAWAAYFNAVGAEGSDVLGNLEEMYRRFGNPSGLFDQNEPQHDRAQRIQDVRSRAESNVKAFEAAQRGISDSWEQFLRENPTLDANDEATITKYINEKKISVRDLPEPDASFNTFLQGVSKDPEANPTFFQDIDARMKALGAEREGLLGQMRKPIGVAEEEETPVEPPDLTERERLVGWLQQEDTRDWAQSHGFRLGTVREPTEQELADIEAGKLPRDYLVKGMVYNPSPDDKEAASFALRQMKLKPQESVLYRLGLRGDRTRRGVSEVTVDDTPSVEGATKYKAEGDKEGMLVRLSDGSYAASTDGENWSKLPEAGANALVSGQRLEFTQPPDPNMLKGKGLRTKTYTLEEQGWIYGRDKGTATGIDATPGSPTFGQRISFPKEQVLSQERIGLERIRPTLAEKMDLRRAQRLEAERQAEEGALIGPKASRAAVKERAETAKRMQELPAAVSTEPGALLEEKGFTEPLESPVLQKLGVLEGEGVKPAMRKPGEIPAAMIPSFAKALSPEAPAPKAPVESPPTRVGAPPPIALPSALPEASVPVEQVPPSPQEAAFRRRRSLAPGAPATTPETPVMT